MTRFTKTRRSAQSRRSFLAQMSLLSVGAGLLLAGCGSGSNNNSNNNNLPYSGRPDACQRADARR